jgi:ergothioneine biosynthesis protein EgtB
MFDSLSAPNKLDNLNSLFRNTRKNTESICEPLAIEDYVVQPSTSVSPPKWHLGHCSWFFEEMVLAKYDSTYKCMDQNYFQIFNSYYKSLGDHWAQGNRGQLSRPTVGEIFEYRKQITQKVSNLILSGNLCEEAEFIITAGTHHEMQHQELLAMDIKNILSQNPCKPRYDLKDKPKSTLPTTESWASFAEGIYKIGYDGKDFAYDNEGPQHKSYLYPFSIQNNFVSNGDYLKFIEAGGYHDPQYWLSEGWDWLQRDSINKPLYWDKSNDQYEEFTMYGQNSLDLNAPVCHVSYFEADAYARWTGFRLPTEAEYEVFLDQDEVDSSGTNGDLHPSDTSIKKLNLWGWTRSHYSPYPGFRSFSGALGEYNGKFMCNQFVLKGGCLFTPPSHHRNSYRNFYGADQRWMFSGIRLARDL